MDERGEKRGERGYRWKEGEGQGGGQKSGQNRQLRHPVDRDGKLVLLLLKKITKKRSPSSFFFSSAEGERVGDSTSKAKAKGAQETQFPGNRRLKLLPPLSVFAAASKFLIFLSFFCFRFSFFLFSFFLGSMNFFEILEIFLQYR